MSGPAPIGITPPNFRLARLVGIFNIIFATQILICGVVMAGYTLTLPLWGRVFTYITKQAEQQAAASKQARLEAVADQEKNAKTEQEKIEAAAKRLEIETRPNAGIPPTVDFTKMGFTEPHFVAWTWAEVLSGLILNVMMLVSGIGLLTWRPWSRPLAVWTALLKIVRLVLLYGYFVLAIVPPLATRMGSVVVEMMTAQQPGFAMPGGTPPVELFVRIYTISYSIMGVGIILGGIVYPVIVLWLLTRPSVKSACSGRLKLPKEPKQPW